MLSIPVHPSLNDEDLERIIGAMAAVCRAGAWISGAMRVTLASRIFEPEPSAASFRLGMLTTELAEHGHQVKVLTVRPLLSWLH